MDVWELVKKQHLTQGELAFLLDLSGGTISKSVSAGIISSTDDWITSVRKYVRHTGEVAAGRRGAGGLDLVAETARLKKLQADRIAIEIKISKREVIHLAPVTSYVQKILSILKTRILGLPNRLRSRISHIDNNDFAIATEVAREFLSEISATPISRDFLKKISAQNAAEWGEIGALTDEKKQAHDDERRNRKRTLRLRGKADKVQAKNAAARI